MTLLALTIVPAVPAAALELTDCRLDAGAPLPTAEARCGTFEVAENPDAPDGRKIALNVAVVPALNVEPLPDPLVILAGGPGQGAVESYLGMRSAFEMIRRDRPILLVDQRGTGASNRLGCPTEETEALVDFDLDEARTQAQACLDQLDGDPRFYTTSVAVRDLDAVRAALGYEQLNLWGGSYGTRVALHYLRRYPQQTRSVIIDGVVPADELLGPAISTDGEASLQQLFARCAETPACADAFGDLDARFDALMTELGDAPVTINIAHPRTAEMTEQRVNRDVLAGIIRLSSYQGLTRALVPLMIDRASKGDFTLVGANAALIGEDFGDLLAMGMHNAVVCSEDAPLFSDDADERAARADSYMGNLQFDYLSAVCEIWPQGIVDDDFHEPVSSDVPVLLLSGSVDPVTPAENAEQAAATLSNARHIVAPQQGHIVSGQGCIPNLLDTFVDDLDPDAIDATCVERLGAVPFFVSPIGPTP